ncbi:MAG: hypothetical protein DRH04_04815 [Deltaproteobacteria bacterium]|nr:MAG: hypothetical protein DRH04_04815 [Deltaproteobacteria bacterium]
MVSIRKLPFPDERSAFSLTGCFFNVLLTAKQETAGFTIENCRQIFGDVETGAHGQRKIPLSAGIAEVEW